MYYLQFKPTFDSKYTLCQYKVENGILYVRHFYKTGEVEPWSKSAFNGRSKEYIIYEQKLSKWILVRDIDNAIKNVYNAIEKVK